MSDRKRVHIGKYEPVCDRSTPRLWQSLNPRFVAAYGISKRPDLNREKLEKTRILINTSVEDCLIEGYEPLVATLHLPDVDDQHILAAAIKAQAQIIVTYNLKDFPSNILEKFGIEAQHPDDFFLNQSDLQQGPFLAAIKRIRQSLKKPSKTPEEYLDVLRRHSLAKTAEFLENFIDVI